MPILWTWVVFAVAGFCIVRGVTDVVKGRTLWGILTIGAGLLLVLTPIPSRAVKFDVMPPPSDQ